MRWWRSEEGGPRIAADWRGWREKRGRGGGWERKAKGDRGRTPFVPRPRDKGLRAAVRRGWVEDRDSCIWHDERRSRRANIRGNGNLAGRMALEAIRHACLHVPADRDTAGVYIRHEKACHSSFCVCRGAL